MRTQTFEDEKSLSAMLIALSRGNPNRAAGAIAKFLENDTNKTVRDAINKLLDEKNWSNRKLCRK